MRPLTRFTYNGPSIQKYRVACSEPDALTRYGTCTVFKKSLNRFYLSIQTGRHNLNVITRLDGTCEVDKDTPCAWIQIYERLKEQGRLDNITKVFPAREWEDQTQGSLVLEAYKDRYVKKTKS